MRNALRELHLFAASSINSIASMLKLHVHIARRMAAPSTLTCTCGRRNTWGTWR